MDIPNTGTALIIIVAFLLPGFVTVMMQERTFKKGDDRSDLDRLMRIFLYSGFTYSLLALLAMLAKVHRSGIVHYFDSHRGNPALLVVTGTAVVLFPATLVWLLTKWWSASAARDVFFDHLNINIHHTEATAWDYFMRKRKNVLVRVTYPSGARVLGYYGGDSFAAYGRDGGDLYLERAWTMTNDGTTGLAPRRPAHKGSGSEQSMPSRSSSTLRTMAGNKETRPQQPPPRTTTQQMPGLHKKGGHMPPNVNPTLKVTPPPPPPPNQKPPTNK